MRVQRLPVWTTMTPNYFLNSYGCSLFEKSVSTEDHRIHWTAKWQPSFINFFTWASLAAGSYHSWFCEVSLWWEFLLLLQPSVAGESHDLFITKWGHISLALKVPTNLSWFFSFFLPKSELEHEVDLVVQGRLLGEAVAAWEWLRYHSYAK